MAFKSKLEICKTTTNNWQGPKFVIEEERKDSLVTQPPKLLDLILMLKVQVTVANCCKIYAKTEELEVAVLILEMVKFR
jgi:hypothetical protein